MPIVRDFVFEDDEETGFTGLRPTWFPNASPGSSNATAHDVLEHFRTQTSPLEGECEALGALLLLRLDHLAGMASTAQIDRTPAQILGREISTLLEEGLRDSRLRLPRRRRCRHLADEHAETVIQAAVEQGFAFATAELTELEGIEELQSATNAPLRAAFAAWLRRGYRRALERYRGCDLTTVGVDLYQMLEDRVRRLVDSGNLAIGDRVRLSVWPRTARIEIRVNGRDAYDLGYG